MQQTKCEEKYFLQNFAKNKQPPEVFYNKMYSLKIRKIHRKKTHARVFV